jgi:hypothetical protein
MNNVERRWFMLRGVHAHHRASHATHIGEFGVGISAIPFGGEDAAWENRDREQRERRGGLCP